MRKEWKPTTVKSTSHLWELQVTCQHQLNQTNQCLIPHTKKSIFNTIPFSTKSQPWIRKCRLSADGTPSLSRYSCRLRRQHSNQVSCLFNTGGWLKQIDIDPPARHSCSSHLTSRSECYVTLDGARVMRVGQVVDRDDTQWHVTLRVSVHSPQDHIVTPIMYEY